MNKLILSFAVALVAFLCVVWISDRTQTKDLRNEIKELKESRQKMCDRFAVVVNGSARAASQQIEEKYEAERQERLRTDLPLLIVMSDGCVELPEPTLKASEGGDLKHGVLSLDFAMEAAKSRNWPLVRY